MIVEAIPFITYYYSMQDWDAMEEKAKREDKLKRSLEDSKNEQPSKKRR